MTDKLPQNMSDTELQQHLNAETGKLAWKELERHFARGSVVKVAIELDLVNVAAHFVRDDKTAVEGWVNSGKVSRATEDDASHWSEAKSEFWAVVAAPWVLVQEAVNN